MLYFFDKENLEFKKAKKAILTLTLFIFSLLFIITASFILGEDKENIKYITEETRAIIINEYDKENQFSEERLEEYILGLNFKFPDIVLAQARIETGHFKSKVFKENNNLFGMKEAKQRLTTNRGTENNHAFYDNWKQSVQDYALYAATYLSKIKTEGEYLEYLGQNYAEDPNYVSKIKAIISKKI